MRLLFIEEDEELNTPAMIEISGMNFPDNLSISLGGEFLPATTIEPLDSGAFLAYRNLTKQELTQLELEGELPCSNSGKYNFILPKC